MVRTLPTSISQGRYWRVVLLLIVLIGGLLLFERQRQRSGPLAYRIGTVDPRFGMTREEFGEAVASAAVLWQQAASKSIFKADNAEGAMEINLVYDYRQEAADRLKTLGLKIENTKGSYDEMKARFENLKQDSDAQNAKLTQDFADYNARVIAFNGRATDARRQGGLDEAAAMRLESEQRLLGPHKEALVRRQEELKTSLETLKGMAAVINDFAANHNLDLVNYRDTGSQLGPKFSEGIFEQKGTRRSITIYHFPSHNGLVRVLAHELGHAVGIGHLENPQAVMHRLMKTESPALTADDVAALKAKLRR